MVRFMLGRSTVFCFALTYTMHEFVGFHNHSSLLTYYEPMLLYVALVNSLFFSEYLFLLVFFYYLGSREWVSILFKGDG